MTDIKTRMSEIASKIAAMTDAQRAELAANSPVATIEGHCLSIKNTCLAAMQIPTCTIVGGFNQWKKAGRQVKKGETAIRIFGCNIKKDESGNEAGRTFPSICVFDVTQTELIAQG